MSSLIQFSSTVKRPGPVALEEIPILVSASVRWSNAIKERGWASGHIAEDVKARATPLGDVIDLTKDEVSRFSNRAIDIYLDIGS